MNDGNGYSIVRAGHKHLDILAPLFNAYRIFYEQEDDLEACRVYLWERLSNLESVVFLALEGEQGLGFTQLYPSFTSVRLKRLWILYDLFVIPEVRRQGTGRALMDRAKEFAQATGAARLELSTAIDNRPAQALYESLGFIRDEEFFQYALIL
jgi:ribosomal protein S18 acetylase RimI-like enzyme